MLAHLRIEDFALIEALELDLDAGLNILTGETGAGKSILVDAVGLLRGGRADPAVIRTGAESARIEALFHVSVSEEELALLTPTLERLGIDPPDDGDLVVRRVISRAGKSKVYVGGSLVALSSLVEVGRALVDLSGQHEHQGLSDPATHLEILDAYGDLGAAREAMQEAHTALQSAARTLSLASSDERSRADREDLLRFQLQELDAVNPQAGEDVRLLQERDRLKHAERLSSAAQRGSESLYSGQGAVGDVLVRVAKELAGLQEIEPRLGAIALELQSARVQIEEAARELGH
jgi:DNA repair protein RecN (Recombination protein N)